MLLVSVRLQSTDMVDLSSVENTNSFGLTYFQKPSYFSWNHGYFVGAFKFGGV